MSDVAGGFLIVDTFVWNEKSNIDSCVVYARTGQYRACVCKLGRYSNDELGVWNLVMHVYASRVLRHIHSLFLESGEHVFGE